MSLNPKTRNLFLRTASGIVYVALMVAAVFTSWVAVPLAFFFGLVGIRELYKMFETPELKECYGFANISAGIVMLVFYFMSQALPFVKDMPHYPEAILFGTMLTPATCLMLVLAFLGIFLPELTNRHENPIYNIGVGLLSIVWIIIPLSVLFFVWTARNPELLLAFLILIWMSDTAAYVFGSLFGKHKLAPNISPGKTWEGFLCSCVFTIGLAVGLSYIPYFSMKLPIWAWVVFSLIIQVFGLLGDLTESLFKRKAGVKDSGNVIPGHGGVLDRVDSILFATIPAYLFVALCSFYL